MHGVEFVKTKVCALSMSEVKRDRSARMERGQAGNRRWCDASSRLTFDSQLRDSNMAATALILLADGTEEMELLVFK